MILIKKNQISFRKTVVCKGRISWLVINYSWACVLILEKELNILTDAVQEIIRLTVEAIDAENDYITYRIEPLEEVIDERKLSLEKVIDVVEIIYRQMDKKCKINR